MFLIEVVTNHNGWYVYTYIYIFHMFLVELASVHTPHCITESVLISMVDFLVNVAAQQQILLSKVRGRTKYDCVEFRNFPTFR